MFSKVRYLEFNVHTTCDKELFKKFKKWDILKGSPSGQFEEMELALKRIESNNSALRKVIFGLQNPKQSDFGQINFHNSNLDESQKKAVTFALNQNELSVIHGPPGTGKTTTIAEIIWQVCSYYYIM